MLKIQLCVLALMLSCVYAGKKSLSDNRGLNDEQLIYNFKIKDYVFGSLFPKPQEENKDSKKLMSVDPEKFRYKILFYLHFFRIKLYFQREINI